MFLACCKNKISWNGIIFVKRAYFILEKVEIGNWLYFLLSCLFIVSFLIWMWLKNSQHVSHTNIDNYRANTYIYKSATFSTNYKCFLFKLKSFSKNYSTFLTQSQPWLFFFRKKKNSGKIINTISKPAFFRRVRVFIIKRRIWLYSRPLNAADLSSLL